MDFYILIPSLWVPFSGRQSLAVLSLPGRVPCPEERWPPRHSVRETEPPQLGTDVWAFCLREILPRHPYSSVDYVKDFIYFIVNYAYLGQGMYSFT